MQFKPEKIMSDEIRAQLPMVKVIADRKGRDDKRAYAYLCGTVCLLGVPLGVAFLLAGSRIPALLAAMATHSIAKRSSLKSLK